AAVCDGIRHSLGFEKVSAQVLDPERGVFVARAKSGWESGDDRVDTSLTPDDVRRLVDPGLLRQGCSLLERERALSLTGARGGRYASARNGGGPKAWQRHWLVVPLLDRDHELLGFVWADDPDDRLLPSDARLQTLRMFADQAARALESARSVATLARRNDELAALHETTLELLEQVDAKPMLETIVERARDLVRADDGFLYVPDPDDAECMTVSVAAGPFDRSRDTRIHRGEGISGRVWERRLPLVIDDYSRWEGRVGSLD